FICQVWCPRGNAGPLASTMFTQGVRLSRQYAQPLKDAARNFFAIAWLAALLIQLPVVKTLSSSIDVPTCCIEITLRSFSVVSFPVFGFFDSRTCATSLYVIAEAASAWRFMKKSIVNGSCTIFTPLLCAGSMPCFASAANTSNSLPPSQLATFLFFSFAIEFSPVSFHVSSVKPLLLKTWPILMSSTPCARDNL